MWYVSCCRRQTKHSALLHQYSRNLSNACKILVRLIWNVFQNIKLSSMFVTPSQKQDDAKIFLPIKPSSIHIVAEISNAFSMLLFCSDSQTKIHCFCFSVCLWCLSLTVRLQRTAYLHRNCRPSTRTLLPLLVGGQYNDNHIWLRLFLAGKRVVPYSLVVRNSFWL